MCRASSVSTESPHPGEVVWFHLFGIWSSAIGRRIFRQAAAVLLIVLVLPIAALGQTTRLTFLHTNDTDEIVATRGWGGFAQLMTVPKEHRAASAPSLTTFSCGLLCPS